jgi:iron-sulfur cluster assembly protein
MESISVTPTAVENIKKLQIEYEAPGFGLRFGLTGGGCSGYRYVIELEEYPESDDLVFDVDGIKVFVKGDDMVKLKNSTIDWVDTLMESGFDIINPQAKRPCGCGESVDFSA